MNKTVKEYMPKCDLDRLNIRRNNCNVPRIKRLCVSMGFTYIKNSALFQKPQNGRRLYIMAMSIAKVLRMKTV